MTKSPFDDLFLKYFEWVDDTHFKSKESGKVYELKQ